MNAIAVKEKRIEKENKDKRKGKKNREWQSTT
jgi:hypothetical protein